MKFDELFKPKPGSEREARYLAACSEYRAKLDKLESENAELREDKERLDWLDAQRPSGTLPHEGSWTVIGKGNLRTAIDAARKEAQP